MGAVASRWGCVLAIGLGGLGRPAVAAEPSEVVDRAGAAEPSVVAEPAAVRLELKWSGPAECPAASLADAVTSLLEGSSVAAPIRVEATVERTADGWSIVTAFDAGPGRAGRRRFQALTCTTATQAAALALALAVDPTVLDRLVERSEAPAVEPVTGAPATPEPPVRGELPVSPEPTEPPEQVGPIVAVVSSTTVERAPAEPSSRWRGLLGVSGSIDGGALPGPGFGLVATAGVLHGRFRGELVGSYRSATERRAASDPAVGGALWQWTLGGRGCGVPHAGPVELPLCLGVEAGRTVGRGVGLPVVHTTAQPWLAGVVEAGIAWPVRPWLALTARASLAVPMVRQDFSIIGLGVVHRVGPASGRGLAGLELRWP